MQPFSHGWFSLDCHILEATIQIVRLDADGRGAEALTETREGIGGALARPDASKLRFRLAADLHSAYSLLLNIA